MPRPPRPVADGLLYHALNRGNNRAGVFATAADFGTFLHALGQTQRRLSTDSNPDVVGRPAARSRGRRP